MQRNLIQFGRMAVVCLAGAILLVASARAEATIVVTTTADGVVDDVQCSLREAVLAANSDSAVGGCAQGAGADTIVFDPNLPKPAIFLLTTSGANEDAALTGDLDISGTLTINGDLNADQIIIDGNDSDRVIEILGGAHVAMSGVTLRHGNAGADSGGGVLVDLTARLTLTNTQILSSTAGAGGGAYVLGKLQLSDGVVAGNNSGGLTNQGGDLQLFATTVSGNLGDYGVRNQGQASLKFIGGAVSSNVGGIYNDTATALLSDLVISQNTAGGVSNKGASLSHLTLSASQVISNGAVTGAGVFNEGVGATTSILNSRISGNVATSSGGGVFNNGILSLGSSTLDHNRARAGGGLHHFGGNTGLINVTISQNQASDNGGGLYNGGSAILKHVTFFANRANGEGGNVFNDEAQLSMGSTIVALAAAGGNCVNSSGFLNSGGYNLESANTCNFNKTGDIVNSDPLLGPLQDNGGPTPTHALLTGSPAIDKANPTGCPTKDQRGAARPQGSGCDIGAFEAGSVADLAIAISAAPATVGGGEQVTYTLTITNLGPESAANVQVIDQLPAGAVCITATMGCGSNGKLTWLTPALDAGASLSATVVISAPLSAGAFSNTATVNTATADLNAGNNTASAVVTVTGEEGDMTAPGPVANLAASNLSENGVTLTWDSAVDDVGVAGYRIYAQQDALRQAAFLIDDVGGATTMVVISSLTPGTGYQLWVVAYDAAGNEIALADATPVHITTLGTTPATSTPTATPTATSVDATPATSTPTSTPSATPTEVVTTPPTATPTATLEPGRSVRLSVEPMAPTTSDAISITVSGVYTNSCLPHYETHQVLDHLIAIQSAPSNEPFCLPAEFPWGYTIGLDPLAAGPYTATHTLEDVVSSTVFSVTQASEPVFDVDESQPHTAIVDQPFQFVIHANGAPQPTYTLIQFPSGMMLDPISGQLTWTPPPGMVGATEVIVRATNSVGSSDYTLTITVAPSGEGDNRLLLPLVASS